MIETVLQPNDQIERCGFILHDGEVVELPNIADDKKNSYEIDPEAALPYIEEGTIVATWHTHPDGEPTLSGEDYAGFLAWPNLAHYIVGLRNSKVEVSRYRVEDGLVLACD